MACTFVCSKLIHDPRLLRTRQYLTWRMPLNIISDMHLPKQNPIRTLSRHITSLVLLRQIVRYESLITQVGHARIVIEKLFQNWDKFYGLVIAV